MDRILDKIEEEFQNKLLAYSDLLTIFRKERDSIVNADVSALWKFCAEKQEKVDLIEEIRERILMLLEKSGINHGMRVKDFNPEKITGFLPASVSSALRCQIGMINRVKNQINITCNSNRYFIEEYLEAIDEIVYALAGNESRTDLYNQSRIFESMRHQEKVLISREV